MTAEEEAQIRNKASTDAVWELIQDLINNVASLRAENAVLKERVGKTASS